MAPIAASDSIMLIKDKSTHEKHDAIRSVLLISSCLSRVLLSWMFRRMTKAVWLWKREEEDSGMSSVGVSLWVCLNGLTT